MEQAGDRIDVTATILDRAAQPQELEASLQLTVPEERNCSSRLRRTHLRRAGHGRYDAGKRGRRCPLNEVSGYIIVRTTEGSLVCTQCAGKLDFKSIRGGAQVLQPALTNVSLFTTSGIFSLMEISYAPASIP